MAKYEFRFTVTGVDLSNEMEERVSRAVGQAGALALAAETPEEAQTVRIGPGWWWRGIPPVTISKELQEFAVGEARE
jgi:hypothetical protein